MVFFSYFANLSLLFYYVLLYYFIFYFVIICIFVCAMDKKKMIDRMTDREIELSTVCLGMAWCIKMADILTLMQKS